jgi:hypothetical protein
VKAAIRLLWVLLLATPLAAQTVNHGSASGFGAASVVWTNPQAVGDTLIFTANPSGGTFTDTAGDTFISAPDCSLGTVSFYRAPTQPFTSNTITYTLPNGSDEPVTIWGSEQTGAFNLDTCGTGSASTTSNGPAVGVSATPTQPPQPTDLAYAFLIDTPGASALSAAPQFTIMNGRVAPFFGAGAYTGVNIDAIGSGTGPAFLLDPGTGANSAQILEAWYSPVAAPRPVTLTISGTATYAPATASGTGAPIFPMSAVSFSVLEQEGSSWVNIGTPTLAANGTITGAVTVNPNFTSSGAMFFEVDILGLPAFYSAGISPSTFEHGSTGFAITVYLFPDMTIKSFNLALTP